MVLSSYHWHHFGCVRGSSSGLQRKIKGFPHLMDIFFLYLSVTVNSNWAPHHCFLFGMYSNSMSSKIIYLESLSKVSRLVSPCQYVCGPSERAHRVFPNLDLPINRSVRGLS